MQNAQCRMQNDALRAHCASCIMNCALRRFRGADGFRSRRDATDQTVCWLRFAPGPLGPGRGTDLSAPVHLGRHLAVRPCSLERR